MREASTERQSRETDISCKLNIDGNGANSITTPIPFFSHMLEAFSKHSLVDLDLSVKGDIEIDQHHTVEDTGIILGSSLKKALGEKKNINRSGFFIFPMDESVAVVSIDLGGRPYLVFEGDFTFQTVNDFDLPNIKEFFAGLSQGLSANICIKFKGENDHHKAEAIFKAFAKSFWLAANQNETLKEYLPSTKGIIDDL